MTALLFDIDGTLLSAGGSGGPAMAKACEAAFGEAYPAARYDIPFAGRTDTAITLAYHAAHAAEPTAESVAAFRSGYLDALPAALADREGTVLPGVVRLLETLASRGDVFLGLLTGNFREGAAAKLSHFGLDRFFDLNRGGYGCDSEDRCDVAAAAVATLPAAFRENRDAVWVLGDTPADVACGKSVGARTLAVATGGSSPDELRAAGADAVLADLSDTPAALAALGLQPVSPSRTA